MQQSAEPRNLERERAHRVLSRFEPGSDVAPMAIAIQESLGYVPERILPLICERARVAPDVVKNLMETDDRLRSAPGARHRVTICTGRTCARRGGAKLVKLARLTLGISLYSGTADGALHLEPFRCFGECAMAPNIRIDGATRGAMTESRFRLLLGALLRRRD